MTGAVVPFPLAATAPESDIGDAALPLDTRDTTPPDEGGGGGGGSGGAEEAEPRFGPVVPLGTDIQRNALVFVLLAASGNRTVLGARQIQNVAELSGLFGGSARKAWLAQRWPQTAPKRDATGRVVRDDEGHTIRVPTGDFSARDLGDDLITACCRLGPAHLLEQRKDGVWSGPDGGLCVHVGDRLWTYPDGTARAFGWRDGSAIYLAGDRRQPPAAEPATGKQCQDLAATFARWPFAPEHRAVAPVYLLGMVAAGIYGAALDWVPHLWVRGEAGLGKSTLLELVAAAAGADEKSENISEPWVRNRHSGRSHLIVLDEKEANSKGIADILALMRAASSGGVSGRLMDGAITTYHLHVPFLLGAITSPAFEAADLSRITMLALRREEVVSPSGQDFNANALIEASRALHPALLTRLVVGWPRFQQNLAVYHAALRQNGATSRSADQLATLLAGHRTLVDDTPIDPSAAAEEIDVLQMEVVTSAIAAEADAGRLALSHLLASPVRVGPDGKSMLTVAALLEELRDLADELQRTPHDDIGRGDVEARAKRRAREAGMLKLRWAHGEGLYLGNTSPQINRLFDGTTWANKVWRQVLRDLPGARDGGSIHFRGGGQDRTVFVPESVLRLPPPSGDDPLGRVQPASAETEPDPPP